MNHSIASLLLVLFLTLPVQAATPTVSPRPTTQTTQTPVKSTEKIDDLKDRLATKVAELRKVVKTAIHGVVKTTSISQMTVETPGKDMKIDIPDELLVFQMVKGKRTKLTADQLEKNDPVTIFGTYDDTLGVLKASVVFIESSVVPVRIVGTITEVNKTDYYVVVKTATDQTYTVDFETTTKAQVYENGSFAKAGFSKASVGAVIAVVGTKNADEPNRVSATRISIVPTDTTDQPTAEATVAPTGITTTTPAPTKKP